MFVRISVNLHAVSGAFDYSVPPEWAEQVRVGQLVTVPFGSQVVQGVILEMVDAPAVKEVRSILSTLDPLPVLTPAQIDLAQALAQTNLASLSAIVDMMLPPGLSKQADTLYELRDTPIAPHLEDVSATASRILRLLREKGPLRGRQIERHFLEVDWRKSAQMLVRRGLLQSQSVLPAPTVRPKYIRVAELAVAPEVAEAAMSDLGKTEATRTRRAAALRFIMRVPDAVNVSWVYAESGCNLADLQELAERELIVLRETEIWRDPLQKIDIDEAERKPELTAEQRSVWTDLQAGFEALARGENIAPFLLQGVTGSGKTEVYLRAVEETVQRGRQAIILVPEIALTPQAVRRFMARFPGQVGLVHSRLSDGERYDTWRRARAGLLKLVVGARSALFAPLSNIGLIVVDECHDGSYYQSEPPFYHAVSAAQLYARQNKAVCILGSATPSILQRYQAERGITCRLELRNRVHNNVGLPPVRVVDMREELKQGFRGIFSRPLMDALQQTLSNNEQAILFLNRRGTATYVFCRECGNVLKCPHCDTPLTLHIEEKTNLRCHHCGYERLKPSKCPQCNSTQIREYGLGSEKVEVEIQALFPQARVLRWDWETTRQKDAHELILTHFANHKADILVGTQMLAKGLDLPLVTLVGIVLADVGLTLPDPFASERVFQILTQVAGRAGRSARGGQVVMQTFQPENPIIQAAAHHDFEGSYRMELKQRERLGYPPFGRLARLELRDKDPARAESEARKLAEKLQAWIRSEKRTETTVIGPTPAFFSKLDDAYRWQIVVRGPDPVSLLRGRIPDGWRVEVDPISLL